MSLNLPDYVYRPSKGNLRVRFQYPKALQIKLGVQPVVSRSLGTKDVRLAEIRASNNVIAYKREMWLHQYELAN